MGWWSNLTNIFQSGWNHQLDIDEMVYKYSSGVIKHGYHRSLQQDPEPVDVATEPTLFANAGLEVRKGWGLLNTTSEPVFRILVAGESPWESPLVS